MVMVMVLDGKCLHFVCLMVDLLRGSALERRPYILMLTGQLTKKYVAKQIVSTPYVNDLMEIVNLK